MNIQFPSVGEQVFTLDSKSVALSGLLSSIDQEEGTVIVLEQRVSEAVVLYLMEFLEYQQGEEPSNPMLEQTPLQTSDVTRLFSDQFYASLLDDIWTREKIHMFQLLKLCEFLEIGSLCRMICAFLASRVRGQEKSLARSLFVDAPHAVAEVGLANRASGLDLEPS